VRCYIPHRHRLKFLKKNMLPQIKKIGTEIAFEGLLEILQLLLSWLRRRREQRLYSGRNVYQQLYFSTGDLPPMDVQVVANCEDLSELYFTERPVRGCFYHFAELAQFAPPLAFSGFLKVQLSFQRFEKLEQQLLLLDCTIAISQPSN